MSFGPIIGIGLAINGKIRSINAPAVETIVDRHCLKMASCLKTVNAVRPLVQELAEVFAIWASKTQACHYAAVLFFFPDLMNELRHSPSPFKAEDSTQNSFPAGAISSRSMQGTLRESGVGGVGEIRY